MKSFVIAFLTVSICILKFPSIIMLGESEQRCVMKAANSFMKLLLSLGGR